jgi:peptidoglycan hydrolase-like protein with peptidoglycan-binding domain
MKTKSTLILSLVVGLLLSGVSLAHADVFTENLYYGLQNNSQVSQLQEFLTSQGLYSGPITGNFYFLTLGAVKAFQNQQGITPAAGYFGSVTMAAANKIADAEVGVSNNEAISETGTSTPSVSPASSTPQIQREALLQEVALLEQQLQVQQSSTQALQQIQQNTTPTAKPKPTVNITANGSANSITIPYDTSAIISWGATNADLCNIAPSGWSGISGSQETGNLTTPQTYSLACSGTGGSMSASVSVNVVYSAGSLPTVLFPVSSTVQKAPSGMMYNGQGQLVPNPADGDIPETSPPPTTLSPADTCGSRCIGY